MTKTPEVLLAQLYRDYLEKRKRGLQKSSCRILSASALLHRNLIPDWSTDEIDAVCQELTQGGTLACRFAGTKMEGGSLPEETVTGLEAKYPAGLPDITAFLESLH